MDREEIEDMIETMLIGDSDQGKLRRLLIEYEQEIQHLRDENERLKILADSGKNRVDTKQKCVIDMTRPQPCVRFRNAGTVEWIAKLMEETNEAIQEAHTISQLKQTNRKTPCEAMNEVLQNARERLAMKLTDVVHVCVSWLNADGWDEEARGKLQERVNEKNLMRGYW